MPSIGKVLNKYLLYVYIYHFFTFFNVYFFLSKEEMDYTLYFSPSCFIFLLVFCPCIFFFFEKVLVLFYVFPCKHIDSYTKYYFDDWKEVSSSSLL